MLVPGGQFTVPGLVDVLIYPDDSSAESFYAVRARPRIARADDGTPEISLMLYGKREGNLFNPTGGLLSLTAALDLSPDEEKKVIALLKERLAQAMADPRAPIPAPRLLGIHWLSGTAELLLGSKSVATGKPSMIGDNRCSFSVRLDAGQAKDFQQAWRDQLRGLHVRYLVTVQAAPSAGTRTEFTSSESAVRRGNTVEGHSTYRVETTTSVSKPYGMELEGALDVTNSCLENRLSQVEM